MHDTEKDSHTRSRAWRAVVAVGVLLSSSHIGVPDHALAADTDAPQERADLVLPQARWAALPEDVYRVVFGPDGQAWFVVNATAQQPDRTAFRRQVEAAVGWKSPWVRGGDVLLIDRRGRVWCRSDAEPGVLLGYDPAERRWIERPAKRVGAARDWMCRPVAHESRTRKIYFADGPGVHVLDGETWTFHDLSRENVERQFFYDGNKQFNPVEFAEDQAGRVYAWSGWGRYGWTGTIGCFVHDGRWKQLRKHARSDDEGGLVAQLAAGKKIGSELTARFGVRGVVPVADDKVVLLTKSGPARIMRLPQGNDDTAWPDAGDDPHIDGHVLTHCFAVLEKPAGETWVFATCCETPGGEAVRGGIWRIDRDGRVTPAPLAIQGWRRGGYPDSAMVARDGRVYAAAHGSGCANVSGRDPVRVTGIGEESLRYMLGEDRDGRIFLSDGMRVFAFHPSWPETRLGLKSVAARVPRGEHEVCLDSRGRVWAQVRPADGRPATLAFHDGGWRPAAPRGTASKSIVFMQPLREGKLVVQWNAEGAADYFDGTAWHSHPSLVDLVERRHADLAPAIDNTRPGRDFYAALRVDQAGRIWVRQWTTLHVYDGQEMIDLSETCRRRTVRWAFCWPLPDGRSMLLSEAGTGGGGMAAVVERRDETWHSADRNLPGILRSDYTTRSGLWVDSRGRLWLPRDAKSAGLCDDKGEQIIEETGYPRFEDKAGRIWFSSIQPKPGWPRRGANSLVVMDAAGRKMRVDIPRTPEAARLAEGPPGSIWLVTDEGLLHLHVTDGDDGPQARVVAHYTRGVPRGGMLDAFIDHAGTLWCYGPGEKDYRLWSVTLPKPGNTPGSR